MLYFVQFEFIEPGPGMSPQQFASVVESAVIPSLEQLADASHNGRVVGGIKAGAREGVFITQAENNKEVDEFLCRLPFWPMMKWTVSPLQSLDDRIPLDRQAVQQIKGQHTG